MFDTSFINSPDIIPLKRPWTSNCVACSPKNPNSLRMQFHYSKSLKYTFSVHKVSNQFAGFDRFVHGGIIATLLDEVAGWTIITSLHTAGFTKESQIKYVKPVPTETDLLILGQLLDGTNAKEIKIKSLIYLLNGTLLAEMISIWFIPSIDHLAKISGKSKEELNILKNGFKETFNLIS